MGSKVRLMQAHKFQINVCETAEQPILNVACKEDPAGLGERFNAINFDILDYDEFTSRDLKMVKNFKQGDALELASVFPAKSYPTIVLGEFLEHCVPSAAIKVLKQIHTVLQDDGIVVVTYPLDNRAPERQHGKDKLKVTVPGDSGHDITTWHQTVWDFEKVEILMSEVGFRIAKHQPLDYGFVKDTKPAGYGMVLKKKE